MYQITRILDYAMIKVLSLLPIKENWIVLHSLPDYSDNARVFYDYLIKENYNKDFKIIWLVKDPSKYKPEPNVVFARNDGDSNLPLGKRDYYVSRAKWVVFTHRTPLGKWRKKQVFIHTTHSASQLKGAGKVMPKTKWRSAPTFKMRCGQDGLEKAMKRTGLPEERFLVLGMPRLDLLFEHKDCLSLLFPQKKYKKVFMVMETFRQAREFADSSFESSFGLNLIRDEAELKRLDDYLAQNDSLMIIKPHPMQIISKIHMQSLKNICFIQNSDIDAKGIQLYELLENCDALLTDYSSIYYDFLLLDRPIGFMVSDMEEYSRGFIIDDPLGEMPGMKMTDLNGLEEFISSVINGIDDYKEQRKYMKDRTFKYQDNQNSKRLIDYIKLH